MCAVGKDMTQILAAPKSTQALVCVTNTSAIVLWSGIAACVAYKCTTFPTPFGDSLTDDQRVIKQKSADERRSYFRNSLALSLVAVGAAGYHFLRWRA